MSVPVRIAPAQAPTVETLAATARLVREHGIVGWVAVPRQPGVAGLARTIARRAGVRAEVDLMTNSIGVRYVPRTDRRGPWT